MTGETTEDPSPKPAGMLSPESMSTHMHGTLGALESLIREGQEGVAEHPYLPHAHLLLLFGMIGVAAIVAVIIAPHL